MSRDAGIVGTVIALFFFLILFLRFVLKEDSKSGIANIVDYLSPLFIALCIAVFMVAPEFYLLEEAILKNNLSETWIYLLGLFSLEGYSWYIGHKLQKHWNMKHEVGG